jgi:colicin import membrane protein
MADDPNLATVEQPETTEPKHPEIADVDATAQLLAIAEASKSDPSLRATHAAARAKLAELNKVMQDELDKQREEARKAQEEADREAAEEAKEAKRKAEDEAAAKAEEDRKKAEEAKTKAA